MKIKTLLLSALAALFFNFVLISVKNAGTAIITNVEGRVTIERASGAKETAELGSQIFESDKIISEAGGKAMVYFMDGSIAQLNSNEALLVKATSKESVIESLTGAGVQSREFANVAQSNLTIADQDTRTAALVAPPIVRAEGINTIAPTGPIYDTQPDFIFIDSNKTHSSPVAKEYVLLIIDDKLNEIYRGDIKGMTNTVMRVKVDNLVFEHKNKSSKYYWHVYEKGSDPKDIERAAEKIEGSFIVINDARAKDIAKALENIEVLSENGTLDKPSYHMLKAMYFKSVNLNYDAIMNYDIVAPDKKGSSKNILEDKAVCYRALGKNGSIMVQLLDKILNE